MRLIFGEQTSRILEPRPQGLISSIHYVLHRWFFELLKKLKKNWPVLIFESSYLPATYNHEVLALDISTDCPLLSSLPLPCQVTSAVSVPFLPNTTPKMRKKKYPYKVKNYEQNGAKSFLKSHLNSEKYSIHIFSRNIIWTSTRLTMAWKLKHFL